MPGLLNSPYAGFDPKRDPFIQSQPNLAQQGLLGQPNELGRGAIAGLLGIPGDIAQMIPGSQHSLFGNLPTSERIGGLLGANTQAPDFQAGLIGSPDPVDLARAGGRGLLAMTLFHGTPHRFDRFALDSIGTGEGAQAFGHGLYFAENPGVARSYRNTVAGSAAGGKRQASIDAVNVLRGDIDIAAAKSPDMVQTMIDQMPQNLIDEAASLRRSDVGSFPTETSAGRGMGDLIEDINSKTEIGHLYEIELPDEITERMLDWDAPLDDMNKDVRDKLLAWRKEHGASFHDGETAYKEFTFQARMGGAADPEAAASEALRELGIPGIRFFDGQSRNHAVKVTDDSLHRLSGGVAENYLNTTNGNVEKAIAKLRADAASAGPKHGRQFADAAKGLEAGTIKPSGTRNIVVFDPDDITQVKRDGDLVFENKSGLKPAKVKDVAEDLGKARGLL